MCPDHASQADTSGRPASHSIVAEAPRGELEISLLGVDDPSIIAGYLSDASGISGRAERLFRPRSEADLAAILRDAHSRGVPVTIVAGQTSTTASSVPEGGWILSMEGLGEILSIDSERHVAWAEAGVCLGKLQDRVEAMDLYYPPDPTSRYECTLGGSVACNASGPRSLRYGATRSWIRSLRVVLSCGEVLHLRRGDTVSGPEGQIEIVHTSESHCALLEEQGGDGATQLTTHIPIPHFDVPEGVKSALGYRGGSRVDLVDLFIGSEGTLGVVSQVEVELLDRPRDWLTMMAFFASEDRALDLIETSRGREASGVRAAPDCLEWFDRASLRMIAEDQPALEVPSEAVVALIIEQALPDCDEDESALLADWIELLESHGAWVDRKPGLLVAQTGSQREALRRARHAVPVGVNERAAQNKMPKLGTDFSVPDARLREIVALYHRAAEDPYGLLSGEEILALWAELGRGSREGEAIDREDWQRAGLPAELETVAFGHVGDNHLHVNFLPRDEVTLKLVRAVYAHLVARAIEFGGSPSAEHGIGKTKHASLRQLVGETGLAEMRAVKTALDPHRILGVGNLFFQDDSGDAPL